MTTIDKIISYLTETSPQSQDANAIAQGTGISVSTIRKNLKRMREAGEVAWNKQGNSTYYTLPQQAPQRQDIEQPQAEVEPSIEQPQAEVEPSIEQEQPATPSFNSNSEPTVHVNPNIETTPRVLLDKLRERQAKHRERMQNAKSPQEHAKHNRRYKRATRRLEALEAAHA